MDAQKRFSSSSVAALARPSRLRGPLSRNRSKPPANGKQSRVQNRSTRDLSIGNPEFAQQTVRRDSLSLGHDFHEARVSRSKSGGKSERRGWMLVWKSRRVFDRYYLFIAAYLPIYLPIYLPTCLRQLPAAAFREPAPTCGSQCNRIESNRTFPSFLPSFLSRPGVAVLVPFLGVRTGRRFGARSRERPSRIHRDDSTRVHPIASDFRIEASRTRRKLETKRTSWRARAPRSPTDRSIDRSIRRAR